MAPSEATKQFDILAPPYPAHPRRAENYRRSLPRRSMYPELHTLVSNNHTKNT